MIQNGLSYLMQGRTTFVIAHRLSTIRRAEQILVVEGGLIVERGTHASLYAAGWPVLRPVHAAAWARREFVPGAWRRRRRRGRRLDRRAGLAGGRGALAADDILLFRIPPPPSPSPWGLTPRTHLIPLDRRILGGCYAYDSTIGCGHVFCFVIAALQVVVGWHLSICIQSRSCRCI